MGITALIDKTARGITRWFVDHNFMKTEWSPIKNKLNRQTSKIAGDIFDTSSFNFTFPDGRKLVDDSTKTFTAYGAYVCRNTINSLCFNLSDYPGHSDLDTAKKGYVMSVQAKAELTTLLQECRTYLQSTVGVNPESGKWSAFAIRVPDFILMQFFKNSNVLDFFEKYVKIIAALISMEAARYHVDHPEDLQRLENLLLDVLCSGFDLYSYDMFNEMIRGLPVEFAQRMPLPKVKMKNISSGAFSYTPVKLPKEIV